MADARETLPSLKVAPVAYGPPLLQSLSCDGVRDFADDRSGEIWRFRIVQNIANPETSAFATATGHSGVEKAPTRSHKTPRRRASVSLPPGSPSP
jgi:hypothetical protein